MGAAVDTASHFGVQAGGELDVERRSQPQPQAAAALFDRLDRVQRHGNRLAVGALGRVAHKHKLGLVQGEDAVCRLGATGDIVQRDLVGHQVFDTTHRQAQRLRCRLPRRVHFGHMDSSTAPA